MPIGFIGSIGNFIQNLLWRFGRVLIKHPQYLIPLITIILFFPLEFIDMLLYIIINFFVVIVNIVILFIVLLINVIWGLVTIPVNWVLGMIWAALQWVLDNIWAAIDIIPGVSLPSAPDLPSAPLLPSLSWSLGGMNYYNINFFGSGSGNFMIPAPPLVTPRESECFFEWIVMGLFKINYPIW